MTDRHPITPPPELRAKWITEARSQDYCSITEQVANHAAQWGYDQRGEVNETQLQQARDEELEACCGWLETTGHWGLLVDLRAARRPKPPSLKEQALEDIESLRSDLANLGMGFKVTNILRALEALPND